MNINNKPIAIKSHPISESLIHWYSGAKRNLPWRETKNPYVIWVSEIILQQTRVEQGLPYFERFLLEFPTIDDLANASEDSVLAQWQGLGYYSRARNLHITAKHITDKLKGQFPKSYRDLIQLTGIGPYTAAAISSFCFGEPEPVVDGNVFRVASRLFGIREDISKSSTRQIFVNTLKEVIPQKDPGTFNQAIMEFGATICKPTPLCSVCVLRLNCYAHEHKLIAQLPMKSKKIKVVNRSFHYMVLQYKDKILMKKRNEKDIWRGLYDFPADEQFGQSNPYSSLPIISEPIVHLLSHQRLHVRFVHFQLTEKEFALARRSYESEPYSLKQMLNLPKPKIVVDYLQRTLQ